VATVPPIFLRTRFEGISRTMYGTYSTVKAMRYVRSVNPSVCSRPCSLALPMLVRSRNLSLISTARCDTVCMERLDDVREEVYQDHHGNGKEVDFPDKPALEVRVWREQGCPVGVLDQGIVMLALVDGIGRGQFDSRWCFGLFCHGIWIGMR
jgi:hypothetical protein